MCPPHHFPSWAPGASSVCMGEELPQQALLLGAAHSRSPRCLLHLSSHTPTLGSGPVPSPCRLQYQSVQLKGDDGCHSTLPTVTLKNKQQRIPLSQRGENCAHSFILLTDTLSEHLLRTGPKVGLENLAVGMLLQYGREERRLVKDTCCLWNFLGEGDFPRKQWGMGKHYTGNKGNSIPAARISQCKGPVVGET